MKPPDEGARVAATCGWCGSPMWRVFHGPKANQTHEPRPPDTLAQARLYAEKMIRDRDETVRRCGADLLGILDA